MGDRGSWGKTGGNFAGRSCVLSQFPSGHQPPQHEHRGVQRRGGGGSKTFISSFGGALLNAPFRSEYQVIFNIHDWGKMPCTPSSATPSSAQLPPGPLPQPCSLSDARRMFPHRQKCCSVLPWARGGGGSGPTRNTPAEGGGAVTPKQSKYEW